MRADLDQPALHATPGQRQLRICPADDDDLDRRRQIVKQQLQRLAAVRRAMVGVVVVQDDGDGRLLARHGLHEDPRDAGRHGVCRAHRGQEVVSWKLRVDGAERLDHQLPESPRVGVARPGSARDAAGAFRHAPASPPPTSSCRSRERHSPAPGRRAQPRPAVPGGAAAPAWGPGGLRRRGQGSGMARARSHPPGGRDALGMQSWRPGSSGCSPLLYPRSDFRQRISVKGTLALPHGGMAPHPLAPTLDLLGCRPDPQRSPRRPLRHRARRHRRGGALGARGQAPVGRGLEVVSMTDQTKMADATPAERCRAAPPRPAPRVRRTGASSSRR